MLRLLVINILLLCVLLFGFPAFAQTNPTPAACGFPTGGDIVADVTYTLTANCTQSAIVNLADDIDLTIIGNGYTIDGSALSLEDGIIASTRQRRHDNKRCHLFGRRLCLQMPSSVLTVTI